jgi:hypothetical protein
MLHRTQKNYPNENVLCLLIYGRGDDYNPSASIKGGRLSCHCKYVAISPPRGKHNSIDNTFILVLSQKNKSHEEIIKAMKKYRHYSMMEFYHCKTVTLPIVVTERTLENM